MDSRSRLIVTAQNKLTVNVQARKLERKAYRLRIPFRHTKLLSKRYNEYGRRIRPCALKDNITPGTIVWYTPMTAVS